MAQRQLPVLAASACVWRADEVLLVRRPEGVWAFPGGKVEAGETVQAAARRELYEETGVFAALDHLAGVFDLIRHDMAGVLTHHFAIACFAGSWTAGEAVAASDALEAHWFAPQLALALPLAPHVGGVIANSNRLIQSAGPKLTFV